MADVIGNPTIRAEFDGTALVKGAKDAGAKLKTTFEESNRSIEAAQRSATKRIQGLISQINADKPRRQMFELGQAIQHMGGVSALSEGQVSRLRVQVNQLAAAGAKVPSSLAGMTGGVNKLSAAFTSLATGGGVSGALASLGPAGVIAAGGIGVATVATVKMFNAVKNLAAQAEEWQNVSEATGISVVSVQKLRDYLDDAGFSADDLSLVMKKLQVEIATGGKSFDRFGISLAEIRKLAPEEQLRAVAAAVTAIADPTERAAAATEFFGKQGAAKLAALRGIAAGTYADLHALSEEQVADLKRVDDQLDQAGRAWTNWSKVALAAMLDVAGGWASRFGATQFGALGEAPNIGDTRIGSIFSAPALQVPKGPSAAEQEQERRDSERQDKADRELAAKKALLAEMLAKAAASARKLALDLISGAPGGPTTKFMGLESLPAARNLGMGAMVGAKNYDFGLDAQGFVTFGKAAEDAGKKATKTAAETVTWSDRLGSLADQLSNLAQSTGGFTGKLLGMASALSSGAGGALSGLKGWKESGGGVMGILGKVSSSLGIVGSAIGAVGGIISGVKSLFGGKSKEQKAAEAAAKKQAADDAKAAEIDKAQKQQAAGEQAKGFAEALNDKLAAGGLSEKLSGALALFVGKMGEALGKLGLGIVDARLKESQGFQAASGVAGDVAGALGAASRAGIADVGLTAAASGAAAAIQEQAITAAREAGLSDMEAAKQGSLAIAQILREQLNASIRSGQDLDANTQALIDEAKKNGISILADPAIESLAVQKEQLGVLQEIAGQKYRGGDVQAARGFGPMIAPNLGGGLGPRIQTHPGEMVWVLPREMQPGGMISAAKGIYDERSIPPRRGGAGQDGPTINVYPSFTENPLQTYEARQQLRDHTVQTLYREASRSLASAVVAGRA